ncbi:hypothetical protein D4764_01G0000450 [Takifugu flavidus]|uniref:Uncharacterized protein n=1 Tax=Takifugu flavidus TaxID=433684 RepID=A0A5C6PPN0_9TELE|nr:hypothetical protein D4764_01G0000450 [Takifugu flavidus]
MVGKDAGQTREGLLGMPGTVSCQKELQLTLNSGRALTISWERRGTLSPSGPCSAPPLLRRLTGAVATRWLVPGGNARTRWWTPAAKQSAATVVAKAKTRAWEEFGEAVENNFWTASKRFIRRLRKGKQCTVNTVYSGDGVLLTSTRDVVDQRKEYFEELLNPTNAPSSEEAGPGDLGTGSRISGAEVAEVVKKLLGGKGPEFLKALDVVGLSWLTRLCNIA